MNYSDKSLNKLNTCDEDIVEVFLTVDESGYESTIIQGARTGEEQKANLANGKTTTLKSKHLERPSQAVDASPWPVPKDWGSMDEVLKGLPAHVRRNIEDAMKERMRFVHFAGYVQGVARMKGTPLRWGGDWDGDKIFTDQKFDDLVHFEKP